jgi:hypothetical protein
MPFADEKDLTFALGALIGVIANLAPRLSSEGGHFIAEFLRREANEIERGIHLQ